MRREELKVYRIVGHMLISHDRFPERRIFRLEIPATKESEALEKVYSLLGSRHKLKRRHIEIAEIREIQPSEALSPYVKKLLSAGEVSETGPT